MQKICKMILFPQIIDVFPILWTIFQGKIEPNEDLIPLSYL